MQLEILLPFKVFARKEGVSRIVAETPEGSFGLWPHRLDCVAALVAGIFTFETPTDGEIHLALDEGVLVKTGPEVVVAVRNAVGGADLGRLHEAVKQQFLNLNERERKFRSVLARLEGSFIRRFTEVTRHE